MMVKTDTDFRCCCLAWQFCRASLYSSAMFGSLMSVLRRRERAFVAFSVRSSEANHRGVSVMNIDPIKANPIGMRGIDCTRRYCVLVGAMSLLAP